MNDNNVEKIYSNFKRSNKWLGIIDYRVICVVIAYIFLVIKILQIFSFSMQNNFSIFCILLTPIIAFLLICSKEEYAFEILFFIFKFYFSKKIYVNGPFYIKFNSKIYKQNIVNCKNR